MNENPKYIDVRNVPLEQWLNMLKENRTNIVFIHREFPSNKHLEEYIASVHSRSDEEIRWLLRRFLVDSGNFGNPLYTEIHLHNAIRLAKDNPDYLQTSEFYRRFLSKNRFTWEGNTWILDLLPHWPKAAISALEAYILAHAQLLPDAVLRGLYDALAVIRARFIGLPANSEAGINALLDLSWRQFEVLIYHLYMKLGYEVELTVPSNDGGRDVIAQRQVVAAKEKMLVQVKRYSKNIGVREARNILGVVSDEKSNKGVIVTTSNFSTKARQLENRNPRLELINGKQLWELLNEHMGTLWTTQLSRLTMEPTLRVQE